MASRIVDDSEAVVDGQSLAMHERRCSHEISHSSVLQIQDKLEPIAVIGFSLRFPQDATSPEALWQMLVDGRSSFSEFPRDRFNFDAFYHPDQSRPDTVCQVL